LALLDEGGQALGRVLGAEQRLHQLGLERESVVEGELTVGWAAWWHRGDQADLNDLLLDEPEVYGLPPDPVVTTRDLPAMWRRAALAAAGVVVAVAGCVLSGRR